MATIEKGAVYEAPGREGSVVELKARYENFIGGHWVAPVEGAFVLAGGGKDLRKLQRDVGLPQAACEQAFVPTVREQVPVHEPKKSNNQRRNSRSGGGGGNRSGPSGRSAGAGRSGRARTGGGSRSGQR